MPPSVSPVRTMPKLTSVTVDKLLGRFDHKIAFESEWEFVILYGPNGVGKTKLLELVYAASSCQLERLLTMPFSAASLTYDDGTTISLLRTGQLSLPGMPQTQDETPHLHILLHRPSTPDLSFSIEPGTLRLSPNKLRMIEQRVPVERVGPDEWMDLETGTEISTLDIADRYGDSFPQDYFAVPSIEFQQYREFMTQTPVHLIETQRLLQARLFGGRGATPRQPPPMTVMRYSSDLTDRLRIALAENTTTSQRLDRTFPRRVINAVDPARVTDEQIRSRYD